MKTQQLLEQLVTFRSEANDETFRQIFGKLGDHLWYEFSVRCEFDVVRWYATLDNINRPKLAEALAED